MTSGILIMYHTEHILYTNAAYIKQVHEKGLKNIAHNNLINMSNKMNYQKQLNSMLNDPSVHNWVKHIAQDLQKHDPVDALKDCELLVSMCKARLKESYDKNR